MPDVPSFFFAVLPVFIIVRKALTAVPGGPSVLLSVAYRSSATHKEPAACVVPPVVATTYRIGARSLAALAPTFWGKESAS